MKSISDQYRIILAARLKGMTPRKIASQLKISFATLGKILESDEFKMVQDLAVGLVSGEIPYHPAISAKEEVMKMSNLPEHYQRKILEDDANPPAVRLQAARDLQDRVGGKPKEYIVLDDAWSVMRRVHGSRLDQGMLKE